ncbi:ATP-binding cassette domain-containing protein [Spiroplasma endosymbiont of Stenodema calcarata]|uniref:ATP-binding cassette domain-containing protein n=1 Tax=Spiroplasma endosymbiont of Stenodema calcarata TaxID=3139328 RepID=UPI003CCA8354
MSKKHIEIKDLTKKVKNQIIIEKLNLEINRGEKIAILGANGSGKTTLVELISGITNPSLGHIKIHTNVPKIKQIGLQFQEGYWPKGLTPKAIINYYINKKEHDNAELNELLSVFGIKTFINKELNNLSGGQRQRFNAMLSVINTPEIIILDELITSLDLNMQIQLIQFFQNYLNHHQATLLMVSHIPEEVEKLCERVIVLENGHIIYDLPLTKILATYGTVRKFMEDYYTKLKEKENLQDEFKN